VGNPPDHLYENKVEIMKKSGIMRVLRKNMGSMNPKKTESVLTPIPLTTSIGTG
jgi:hypothetical protein